MTVLDDSVLMPICGNDRDALRDLLELSVQETVTMLTTLTTAWHARDFGRIADAAHRLKGQSATIGAKELADAAAQLEVWARRGDEGTGSPALLDAVSRAVARFRSEVQRRLG